MKPVYKILSVGVLMCLVGALLMDCKIEITGLTLVILGTCTIAFTPLIAMMAKDQGLN